MPFSYSGAPIKQNRPFFSPSSVAASNAFWEVASGEQRILLHEQHGGGGVRNLQQEREMGELSSLSLGSPLWDLTWRINLHEWEFPSLDKTWNEDLSPFIPVRRWESCKEVIHNAEVKDALQLAWLAQRQNISICSEVRLRCPWSDIYCNLYLIKRALTIESR